MSSQQQTPSSDNKQSESSQNVAAYGSPASGLTTSAATEQAHQQQPSSVQRSGLTLKTISSAAASAQVKNLKTTGGASSAFMQAQAQVSQQQPSARKSTPALMIESTMTESSKKKFISDAQGQSMVIKTTQPPAASISQKPNVSMIHQNMKNQKNTLSLLGQGARDPNLDVGGAPFEPVQVAEFIDKSALIVDFTESTAQVKTLLDLEEASLVTKACEPFFVDATNGKLYSWGNSQARQSRASIPEESKTLDQSSQLESRMMLQLTSVPTHGQKLVDIAISKATQTKPILFFTNEKGEVFHTRMPRGENSESETLFPKLASNNSSTAANRQSASVSEDIQSRLDSLLSTTASQLLAEDHIVKLSHSALKSTFINKVACGERHIIFLTSSGFVYSMGSNEMGQLGNPCEEVEQEDGSWQTLTYQSEPSIIFGLLNHKVIDVACGSNHSAVLCHLRSGSENFGATALSSAASPTLRKHSTVFVWGSNASQQLALPASISSLDSPQPLEGLRESNIQKVLCGRSFTAVKTVENELYVFGIRALVQQPIQQLEPDSLFMVCPYSDSLLYSKNGSIHRVTPSGISSQVSLGPDHENKEFLMAFSASENQITLLRRDKQLTPTAKGGCATLSVAQSSKYSVANEHPSKSTLASNPVMTSNFKSKGARDPQNANNFAINTTLASQSASGTPSKSQDQGQDSERSTTSGAFGFLESMASGFQRAISRQSSASSAPQSETSGRQNFSDVINEQYVHQACMQPDELAPIILYVVLTGRIENLGMSEQEFYQARERSPMVLDERDRRPGEDTISYLKRKREIQKQVEKERHIWLTRQAQLEKTVHTVWERQIFPSWDHSKQSHQLRQLWEESSIPRTIRGKVWFLAAGNRGAITRDLFNIMAERGSKLKYLLKEHSIQEQLIVECGGEVPLRKEDVFFPALPSALTQTNENAPNDNQGQNSSEDMTQSERRAEHERKIKQLQGYYSQLFKLRKKLSMLISMDEKGVPTYDTSRYLAREKSIQIIDTDIPRTFPRLAGLFQNGGVHHLKLHRILDAFTMYRPDIGYVQGMSYVAATLLLFMDNEYQSFVTFCNLMTKYPIMPFYSFNDVQVRKIMQLYKAVFAHNLPELCEHFELENIQPKHYIYEWFMTLFTRAFDLKLVTRVWDFYFLDGIFVLFKTSIAILCMLEEQMIDGEMDEILPVLQHVSEHIKEDDEEEFVRTMHRVSFPKWVHEEIPLLESEFFKQDLFD